MRISAVIISILILISCQNKLEVVEESNPALKEIDALMKVAPRAQIMNLGVYHFATNSDSYQSEDINHLSEEKQREIKELKEQLAKFKPTQVAIEMMPKYQATIDSQYQLFLSNEFELPENESYQIGFRLAKQFGITKVYCVDADKTNIENGAGTESYWKAYFEWYNTLDTNTLYEPEFFAKSQKLDSLSAQLSVLEKIKLHNSNLYKTFNQSIYFCDDNFDFATAAYPFGGADGFISSYYNRNLRIFQNLKRIPLDPNKEERILTIFGATHSILFNQFIENSGVFEVVDVMDILDK